MAAPEGNQFWKLRASSGAPRKYADADALWEDCCEYFQARDAASVNGMSPPYTLDSLCVFLDIDFRTWYDWRENRDDLSHVITRVDTICRSQKFDGAACGLYNHNIIARDLGLADKQDHTGMMKIETIELVAPDLPLPTDDEELTD